MRVSVTGRSKSTPDAMRSVSLLFSFRDAASFSFTFAAKYHALRVDENGVSGVYCLVGRVAYFKPVSIVYQGSDYCLVEPGTIEAATESQKSLYTLRPNDEVIVSAGELYNGKVVD